MDIVSDDVKSRIREINNTVDYVDTTPGGTNDAKYVSIGQQGGYSELLYIYERKLLPFLGEVLPIDGKPVYFSKDMILDALEGTCWHFRRRNKNILRKDFYKKLSEELGIVGTKYEIKSYDY